MRRRGGGDADAEEQDFEKAWKHNRDSTATTEPAWRKKELEEDGALARLAHRSSAPIKGLNLSEKFAMATRDKFLEISYPSGVAVSHGSFELRSSPLFLFTEEGRGGHPYGIPDGHLTGEVEFIFIIRRDPRKLDVKPLGQRKFCRGRPACFLAPGYFERPNAIARRPSGAKQALFPTRLLRSSVRWRMEKNSLPLLRSSLLPPLSERGCAITVPSD